MQLIVTNSKGLCLQTPYTPRNFVERNNIVTVHRCINCNKVDYVTGDDGPLRKMQELRYHVVVLKCKCGFTNNCYVVVNDLSRVINKNIPNSIKAMKGVLKLLPPVKADLLVINSALAGFRKDYDLAMLYVKASLQITKDSAPAWYNYGFLCTQNNDLDEALNAYKKTLACDPKFYSAYFHMAIVQNYANNNSNAKTYLEKFLLKYPDYLPAKKLQAKIKEAMETT